MKPTEDNKWRNSGKVEKRNEEVTRLIYIDIADQFIFCTIIKVLYVDFQDDTRQVYFEQGLYEMNVNFVQFSVYNI